MIIIQRFPVVNLGGTRLLVRLKPGRSADLNPLRTRYRCFADRTFHVRRHTRPVPPQIAMGLVRAGPCKPYKRRTQHGVPVMMRNYGLAGLALVIATAMVAPPASAHHSYAMFAVTKQVAIEGTVKQFMWTNPHSWI